MKVSFYFKFFFQILLSVLSTFLLKDNKPPKNPRRSFNPNRKSISNQLLITARFLQSKETVKFNKNHDKDIFIISEDEGILNWYYFLNALTIFF